MKIRHLILCGMCMGSLASWAVPARPGVTHRLTQPDGTIVSLQLVGDENHHYYLTTDGQIVIGGEGKYCYASVDDRGELLNTGIMAHDPASRSDKEKQLIGDLNFEKVSAAMLSKAKAMKAAAEVGGARSNNQDYKGRIQTNYPTIGQVRTIVILANYSDVKFSTPNANEYFTRMLNEEGFSDNGAKGSCRDYYLAASAGQFDGSFDVYGPVNLPHERAYYGRNNLWGSDTRPQQMIIDAVSALDDEVDFTDYDLDGDLNIDNVFVFYAGLSEAGGGGEDTVWPHQATMATGSRYRFDGKYLNRYACSSELVADGKTDGIGTFIHEFGHVLGIPDLYNTESSNVYYTPCNYSAMDQGCYLGDSMQPPTFSAYERNALGWMSDNLVEITGPASCRLENLEDSNKAYLINTDKENEFFLLENRQNTGWDSLLPGHGMLIWHIDYDPKKWSNNSANNDPEHQHIDLVEASDKTGATSFILRRYPFPGLSKVRSFTYDTTPSFRSWSGKDLGLPITNIQETDGVITFDVAGGGSDPASIADVTSAQKIRCTVTGRNVMVETDGAIRITDLTGRTMATGADELSITVGAPGVYIVSGGNGSQKILVK